VLLPCQEREMLVKSEQGISLPALETLDLKLACAW
jgi:hypothetical protein